MDVATALFSVNMHTLVKLQEFATALSPPGVRAGAPVSPVKQSSLRLGSASLAPASLARETSVPSLASPARSRSAASAARGSVEPLGKLLRSQLSALKFEMRLRAVELVLLSCRTRGHPEEGMFELARCAVCLPARAGKTDRAGRGRPCSRVCVCSCVCLRGAGRLTAAGGFVSFDSRRSACSSAHVELERFELTDPSAEPSARMVLQVAARPAPPRGPAGRTDWAHPCRSWLPSGRARRRPPRPRPPRI